jgi:hypothetical protein
LKFKKIIFLLFFTLLYAEENLNTLYSSKITLKQKSFQIWLALTPKQHAKGLQSLIRLEKNKGMLFSYPLPEKLSFWMKETMIDLDIAFLKRDGTITDIFTMRHKKNYQYTSSTEVSFALELNAGTFSTLKLRRGDKISIPKDVQAFL